MINLINPYDKPMGFDFYADIMRQTRPGEAIKIYYRFLFEERLKREKIAAYTRKLNQVENSNFVEKNNLIERHQSYKEKILENQRLKKGIDDKRNLAIIDSFMKISNHLNTKSSFTGRRQKKVVVESDGKKASEEEKLFRTFEALQEKQKTFLTSLDDFEASSITFSSRRESNPYIFNEKIKLKPETKPKTPIKVTKKKVTSSLDKSLPQLVKKEKKSKSVVPKVLNQKPKVPPIELPLEYGEVLIFPIITKQKP